MTGITKNPGERSDEETQRIIDNAAREVIFTKKPTGRSIPLHLPTIKADTKRDREDFERRSSSESE